MRRAGVISAAVLAMLSPLSAMAQGVPPQAPAGAGVAAQRSPVPAPTSTPGWWLGRAPRSTPAAGSDDGASWRLVGQVLAAVGAGTLSAVATPIVIRSAGVLATDDDASLQTGEAGRIGNVAMLSSLLAGGVGLALGAAMWHRGEKMRRRHLQRTGALPPLRHRSPGMRSAGIALTISGSALSGAAVVAGLLPGECVDTNPPECS